MSDEQPRMSRREMRAKGLLAPILDGASPLDDLTPTAEIRLKRLTRKEMREREAGLTREDSGSSASDGHGKTASTGGSTEGVGAHGRFPSAIPERAGSAHEPASRASHVDSSRTSTHHGGHAAPAEGFSTTGNITPVATVAAAEVGLVEGRWPAGPDDKSGKGASGGPGGLPVPGAQKPGADSAALPERTGSFASVAPEAPQEAPKGLDRSADSRSQAGTPFRNQPSSPQSTTGTIQPTPPSSPTQSIPSAAQPAPSAPTANATTQAFANPTASREDGSEAFDAAGRSSVFSRFDGGGLGGQVGDGTGSHLRIGQCRGRRICSVSPVVRVLVHPVGTRGRGRVRQRGEGLQVEVDGARRCRDEQQGEDKQCFFHGVPSCAVVSRVGKPGFIPLGGVWALCSSRIYRASGSFVLSAALVVASRAGMCRQHLPCRAISRAVVLQAAK